MNFIWKHFKGVLVAVCVSIVLRFLGVPLFLEGWISCSFYYIVAYNKEIGGKL